jgi:2,4-dienoyl-CoA reductase-like NADH-dependent reductase (Old Yellow Enzyme family)/thioredoxin reductase
MTYEHLFTPLQIGPVQVKNRVVLPPHGHVVSSLWASHEEAERHIAYWAARTEAGWVDGVSAHVRNTLVPGFEPTGVGAQVHGHFRQPWFVDRVGRLAQTLHADGTVLTVQMILQGGMPHGASPALSGTVINLVPHPLTVAEIDYFVEEYRHGAEQVRAAGADGVEIHLNHDDMLEYFISPLTNRRTDEYGGSLANRLRFPQRVLQAVRDALGPDKAVGVRLNLREEEPGGYDVAGAVEIARHLEASGLVDYLSCAIGSPWGNPSYIQSHHHRAGEWSHLAGEVRRAVGVPVVYTGRVTSPEVAERILASGHADLVGMARAHIADDALLRKAREGREDEITPCVGGNECISRRLLEGVSFSCAVNPTAGRETMLPVPTTRPRKVLVLGGGPAGMETAALAAERGHDVELWEAEDRLGGQLAIATVAPRYDDYADYLRWQERRLARAGVTICIRRRATVESAAAHGADTVVVATGGTPRFPGIPGEELAHVHQWHDVLLGEAELGARVLVVSQDDHLAPLAIADFVAGTGAEVTLVTGSTTPAPLVSRYLIGSALGRLDEQGVQIRTNEQVSSIEVGRVWVRNVYSHQARALEGFDSVVLACGVTPQSTLFDELGAQGRDVHVLGDAYAPRRLVWATRQAYELVGTW